MGDTVRERIQANERLILSNRAMLSENSEGRKRPEAECPMRTCFQRDRDRIIHCRSFRRLKHKTQVFLSPEGDHYRTRLTHTLEVAQIARTISRALMLNEDLTEAIALGHDLGHTPFGHAGERALNEVYEPGFKHFLQSGRVVEKLEKNGKGLNLTAEVIDGIICHTVGTEAKTIEGRVVKLSDKIAYINHDIDDAFRAGVLKDGDIPKDIEEILGNSKSKRINTLVTSVIENGSEKIGMDEAIGAAFERLNKFMFDNVYTNPVCKGEEGKAEDLVKRLFYYFAENPEKLPPEYAAIWEEEGAERAACDYIAGMTDQYAMQMFYDLFVPFVWSK